MLTPMAVSPASFPDFLTELGISSAISRPTPVAIERPAPARLPFSRRAAGRGEDPSCPRDIRVIRREINSREEVILCEANVVSRAAYSEPSSSRASDPAARFYLGYSFPFGSAESKAASNTAR